MAPFSASKSTQNRSKLDPEGHPKIDTFSHRLPTLFCSILAPKMGPCWGQVGTKIASRAGPDLTLCRPDPFLVALGPPQQPLGLPNLPKEPKSPKMDQFLIDFWSIFDDFGTYFGTYFWSFLIFLGVNFWSFWSQVLLITWLKGSGLTVKCLGLPTLTLNPKHFTLNH